VPTTVGQVSSPGGRAREPIRRISSVISSSENVNGRACSPPGFTGVAAGLVVADYLVHHARVQDAERAAAARRRVDVAHLHQRSVGCQQIVMAVYG
jgi:hypothetical protein